MIILLPVLIGLYLIMALGYFKMVKNAVPDFWEEATVLVGFVSMIWPVAILYTLVKEAVT